MFWALAQREKDIERGREKGREEGREKGREEGREERDKEIERSLQDLAKQGVEIPPEVIRVITGESLGSHGGAPLRGAPHPDVNE